MKFKEVQKAIIQKDDAYLVILRSSKSRFFPECWDFPGGKLEEGEDPKTGIAREIFEETGLRMIIGDIVRIYEVDLVPEHRHRYTVYATSGEIGDIVLSHEHTAYRWATKEELLKLPLHQVVKMYFDDRDRL